MDGKIGGRMDSVWMDEWMNRWMNRWMDGQMDEWMDRWMDGQMDGQMDGKSHDIKYFIIFCITCRCGKLQERNYYSHSQNTMTGFRLVTFLLIARL